MHITNYILDKTDRLTVQTEVTGDEYLMFNTGGVEVEVAEFLYSWVRLLKPNFILETGTHLGISSLYMALGLKENNKGILETYEVIPELLAKAQLLWQDLGMTSLIHNRLQPSLSAPGSTAIDLLFLDSEPQFRFDEFLYFWDRVVPGGFILIHDLHYTLGKSGLTHEGMDDWPYGPWEEKLGSFCYES